MSDTPVRLTEYSHGAGCGCKISPKVLDQILVSQLKVPESPNLLVGNSSKDDAAAYDLGNGQVVLSTTDFFMPIVDDPFDFGRIAATNAISDIYAMGGNPLMAIAILGWPINLLPAEVAQQVVEGGRQACADAGIPLAGGHSIDAPEPIFGLAVTGLTSREQLKQNDRAQPGDKLYLTKPLGIGILTTAQKQKKLLPEHTYLARDIMCRLNSVGARVSALEGVNAITDVTGFGLMGHLLEVCEGSGVQAVVNASAVPVIPEALDYLAQGCVPGGTGRNLDSYGHKLAPMTEHQRNLLCDPQTSGGLLIAIRPDQAAALETLLTEHGVHAQPIGELEAYGGAEYVRVEGEVSL
ncbi:Selenide,water dikinase [Marinobacterium lacunae]|uniref:Selenide, water dikinase n=1 Tax=Marinobacterium lacunae TaxID=1232683 RepID=A0A081FVW5_9GAMM|nr:selenide, water dikinase SelD [Marinobacterium lacunae]KEA62670.1 Selenide,water dikinase [Marinobacterium lacunae]MBR9882595.1 selenide, water dikinase SelD [Oceanospirillales bacterium]